MRFSSLSSLATIACLAATVALTPNARANEITNGNFATTSSAAYPGYGAINDWTSTNTNSFNTYMSGSAVGTPFMNGNLPGGATSAGFIQVYQGNGGPATNSLFQDVNLVQGDSYYLSFYDDARDCCSNNTPQVEVELDGTVFYSGTASATSQWNYVGIFFTYTGLSGSVPLDFIVNANPGGASDETALLTGVSLTATPEPSSILMLGTGLLGLAGVIRRKVRV